MDTLTIPQMVQLCKTRTRIKKLTIIIQRLSCLIILSDRKATVSERYCLEC